MSGKLKGIRDRIKAVVDTQQITKAMKMVAAAKLRKAQDKIIQIRPYANKLHDIMKHVLQNTEGDVSMAFGQEREPDNVLIVLITSEKGLCGGYNSNLIKLANKLIKEKYTKQFAEKKLQLLCIGKKGFKVFQKKNFNMIDDHLNLMDKLDYQSSIDVSDFILKAFLENTFDVVELVYSQFKNAATQINISEQFLPISKLSAQEETTEPIKKRDYIFEPSQKNIIQDMIPLILKTQFFRTLLDANASEHGARMIAMDKATENANELLKDLKLYYNRARQEEITKELTEIVGGAEALSGG